MKSTLKLSILITTLFLSSACTIRNTVINVGQKTSVERQLMGEIEGFSEEEMLVSSVRSGVQTASPEINDNARESALAARRRQLFNRDDIHEFKKQSCLGEDKKAQLQSRPCAIDSQQSIVLERVISQENTDRDTILQWVLKNDPSLTANAAGDLRTIYADLLKRQSPPGTWLINKDGKWEQKAADE
ncbi:DUF1318 domain-containing protein [Myxococcota bacterium]|nr:DUF1318 domain-containing protein [Myxococcota bacterium]